MTTALHTLLQRARDYSLENARPYRLLNSGYPASPEELELARGTLQSLCEKAASVQESLLWFEKQKAALPTGTTALGIECCFGQFEAVRQRYRRHDVELFEELQALRHSLQAQLTTRATLERNLQHQRARLNALKDAGLKLDFLELSLSRLEAQALFGHEPDETKLSKVDETLTKAESELGSNLNPDDSSRVQRMAEALIERQKDRMTVAQSQKIQSYLSSLHEPASRRGLWNLLRANEREGHMPLEFTTIRNTSEPLENYVEALSDDWQALIARFGQKVEGAQS
jgi:hypothetical protein